MEVLHADTLRERRSGGRARREFPQAVLSRRLSQRPARSDILRVAGLGDCWSATQGCRRPPSRLATKARSGAFKRQIAWLDLLLLDEFGYLPATTVGAGLLFDVIPTAYEHASMIVTTSLPFEHWTEVLGCKRLTRAGPRPAHPPLPHHRNPRRELPTPPPTAAEPTAGQPDSRPNERPVSTIALYQVR